MIPADAAGLARTGLLARATAHRARFTETT